MNMKLLCLLLIVFCSCSDVIKPNKTNSFYVRYTTNDSILKNDLILVSRNKVSYYDSVAKLYKVIPINYKTNDAADMHFFFTEDQSDVILEDGMILYDIELKDSSRLDSTAFSIKKKILINKTWSPKSDMGWINVYFPAYTRAVDERKRKNLATYIMQTIAKDSYSIQ